MKKMVSVVMMACLIIDLGANAVSGRPPTALLIPVVSKDLTAQALALEPFLSAAHAIKAAKLVGASVRQSINAWRSRAFPVKEVGIGRLFFRVG